MKTIECEMNADILSCQILSQLFAENLNVQLESHNIYNTIAVICCDKLELQSFIQTLLHDLSSEDD